MNKEELQTLIIKACRCGDLDIITYLLNKGADAQEKDEHGWSATMIAIHFERWKVLELLVEFSGSERIINDALNNLKKLGNGYVFSECLAKIEKVTDVNVNIIWQRYTNNNSNYRNQFGSSALITQGAKELK